MKAIWKKYNILISAVVFLAMVVSVSFFVILPIRKNIENNSDEIQEKIIDNDIYKERIQKIPEMEKSQAIFEENRNNLKIFLSGSSEVDFIRKIESVAEETGNKITLKIEDNSDVVAKKVTAKKADDKKNNDDIKSTLPGNNKYVTIQIGLEGNYESAFEFMRKLENINYYVNVVSFSMIKEVVKNETTNPFVVAAKNQENILEKEVVKSNFEAIVYLESE